MPFIGKDWRSPGEAWVKTESLGWQRMKIIESQLHPNCHQAHPACSWPPRAQFGQHMAKNCGAGGNIEQTENGAAASPPSDSCGRNNNVLKRLSGHDSFKSGGSSSPDGSCTNSASTSPTGSPEKNSPSLSSASSHHLHPITISSPYGQYTCCSHHYNYDCPLSPCSSPRSTNRTTNHCYENYVGSSTSDDHHQDDCDDARVSKSLSRESIEHRQTSDQLDQRSSDKKVLRHNDSSSDFRDQRDSSPLGNLQTAMILGDHDHQRPPGESSSSPAAVQQNPNEAESVDKQNVSPGTPAILRNGLRITCDEQQMNRANQVEQLDDKSQEGNKSDNLAQQANNQSMGSFCCCCCCCGASNQQQQQQQHICSQNIQREQPPKTAPHCRISVRTREVAMYNTISEAFYRLDFCNAIHDIRRFNYICKLLHLLITQNLTSLSGCATKVLFTMLEQVAWEVSSNKRNIHVLKNLLAELRQMIQKYYCWGRPIGSSLLWQQHFDTIERISQIVDGIELSPPKNSNDNEITFDKLPVEMVREILLRLNDYRDLVNSAQATPLMRTMIDSENIWRKLCHYHFTDQQLRLALSSNELSKSNNNKQSLRGIKYARTTSADGQSSFRNPVRVTRQQQRATQQQQQQQTATGRQQNPARHTATTTTTGNSRRSSTSYVTKAIRIFDRQSSMPETAASTSRHANNSETHRRLNQNSRVANSVNQRQEAATTKSTTTTTGQQRVATRNESASASRVQHQSSSSSPTNNRIDWEHVFHQLRKRYDLKEEYADCLLLCRHCRCLFWKSFGHPCIKGADVLAENDKCFQSKGHGGAGKQTMSSRRGSSSTVAREELNSNDRHQSPSSSSATSNENHQPRQMNENHHPPSVATLSRNFDHNASSPRNHTNHSEYSSQPRAAPSSQSSHHHQQAPQHRNPLNELNARFRQREQVVLNNYRELQHQRQQQRQNNHGIDQQRNDSNNNNSTANSATIKRELVPQHVTITPQAFLKFFSL